MSNWREQAVRGLKPGDTFTDARTFSLEDSQAFGAITGDYNPVHYDPRFCGLKGFNGLILHGLLVLSMVSRMGGQVAWLLSGMTFRMTKPVYPGDTITCKITILDIDQRQRARAEALMFNQQGEKVLEATFSGVLPNETERELLSQMLAEGDPHNGLA